VPLNDLRGQDRAVALLKKLLTAGRVHHAYLFSGPAGSGQREAALAFAQALNCPVDPLGCGRCPRCERIAHGSDPDVIALVRDPESAGREIRVEPVRQVCAALQLAASEGPYKIAIVEDADLLNASAQNALLKTLEEPPPKTVLILLDDGEERLLPTVRSRCLRIPFAPQEAGASNPLQRDQIVEDVLELLSKRGTPSAGLTALAFAERFSDDREAAMLAAGEVAAVLRDLLRVMSVAGTEVPSVNPDRLTRLREVASHLAPSDLLDGLQALEEAIVALQSNGAARLQLEAAALKLGRAA
jgi:DNA polymerase III subunit delta'